MNIKERNSRGTTILENDWAKHPELLKEYVILSDEFEELSKDDQMKVYRFCKSHVTNEVVMENLKQIRYAVSRLYFGF